MFRFTQTVENRKCEMSVETTTVTGSKTRQGIARIGGAVYNRPHPSIASPFCVEFAVECHFNRHDCEIDLVIRQPRIRPSAEGVHLIQCDDMLSVANELATGYQKLLSVIFEQGIGDRYPSKNVALEFLGGELEYPELNAQAVMVALLPMSTDNQRVSIDYLLSLFQHSDRGRVIDTLMTAFDRGISGDNPLREAFSYAMRYRGHLNADNGTRELTEMLSFYSGIGQRA